MDKYYVTCTWMSSEFKNYSSKQRYLDAILVFVIFVNFFYKDVLKSYDNFEGRNLVKKYIVSD